MSQTTETKPAGVLESAATSNPGDPEVGWEFVPYNEEEGQFVAGWLEPEHLASARRQGYCGLAGRPEVHR